jgi:hypothetical protein
MQTFSSTRLAMGPIVFGLFFIFVIIIIAIAAARGLYGGRRVQRPMTEATAFPPPPPPDTVMVKCDYCGTAQTWKETCVKCGAPLPKPLIT